MSQKREREEEVQVEISEEQETPQSPKKPRSEEGNGEVPTVSVLEFKEGGQTPYESRLWAIRTTYRETLQTVYKELLEAGVAITENEDRMISHVVGERSGWEKSNDAKEVADMMEFFEDLDSMIARKWRSTQEGTLHKYRSRKSILESKGIVVPRVMENGVDVTKSE